MSSTPFHLHTLTSMHFKLRSLFILFYSCFRLRDLCVPLPPDASMQALLSPKILETRIRSTWAQSHPAGIEVPVSDRPTTQGVKCRGSILAPRNHIVLTFDLLLASKSCSCWSHSAWRSGRLGLP